MIIALMASVLLQHYAPPAPRTNLAPNPNYNQLCGEVGLSTAACAQAALSALDSARSHENLGPLVLPRDWLSLTPAEQIFVVTNLERVARGETPITGLTAALNAVAETGAVNRSDPTMPVSTAPFVSIWAEDTGPLASDYGWMYQDGYGGPGNTQNLDCTTASAAGCWGHRDNILAEWTRKLLAGHPGSWYLAAGAAQSIIPGGLGTAREVSDAMIVTAVTTPPDYVYTWAEAIAEGAGGSRGVETIPGALNLRGAFRWLRTQPFALTLLTTAILLLAMRILSPRRFRLARRRGKVQDIRRFRR